MKSVDSALDLAAVRELVRPLEPVASVYLGSTPADPASDAAEELALRWRAIETSLADQGAEQATTAAIGEVIARQPVYPTPLAVFAAGGQVRLAQPVPGAVRADRARYGTPPDVVPLLSWLQRHPPYVVVVTDRTGAEVTTVPGGGLPGSTRTVVGPDDEIERNAPGGWSQPRYQRRAEDSWQHNAAAVADAVTRALRDLSTSLLLVAGDVRAVQLLRDELPPMLRRRLAVRRLPGGRHQDGSEEVRREAITAAVDGYVAAVTAAALDRFAESAPEVTVQGVPATLAALAAGRVATLFVADDPDDRRIAWYGPDVLCAARRDDVAGAAGRGRLVDVAARAALLTDAEVRVVDAADERFDDGVGGLCRFPLT